MTVRRLQAMKAKKGFTLVELIVVIAIIAVLAAILIPILMNYLTNSRISSADSEAKSLYNVISATVADIDRQNKTLPIADIALVATGTAWTAPPASGTDYETIINERLTSDFGSMEGSGTVFFRGDGTSIGIVWNPRNQATDTPTWGDTGWSANPPERTRRNIYGAYPTLPS